MAAEAFKQNPCELCCYGVLDDVSIAYPPATGMLLTRYAPFRRSPPEYCYPALPLDLHVLSLPLAFILSQDQTLLCIYTYKIPVRSRQLISYLKKSTLSFLFSVLFACTSFSLFNELANAFFKSGCKGSPFSETTKFFLRKVINNSGRKKFISIIRNEKSAPFPERSI